MGTAGSRLSHIGRIPEKQMRGWHILGWWYSIEHPPQWLQQLGASEAEGLPPAVLRDVKHHLALLLLDREHAAIVCTQGSLRNELVRYLTTEFRAPNGRPMFFPLPEEQTSRAFLQGDARQASLQGLHRPTPSKADSKSFAGPNVRHVIDPFEDQSYRLRTAVSNLETARVDADFRSRLPAGSPLRELDPQDAIGSSESRPKQRLVGLAVRSGAIWSRSTFDFRDFLKEIDNLRHLLRLALQPRDVRDAGSNQPGFEALQREAAGTLVEDLGEPLDFQLDIPFPAEFEDEGADPETVLAAHEWLSRGELRIDEESDAEHLLVAAFLDGKRLATVRIQPILDPEGTVSYNLTVEPAESTSAAEQELLDRLLDRFKDRASIWYRKGVVLQDGRIYRPTYKDVPFGAWRWLPFRNDRAGYEVADEKPTEEIPDPKIPGRKVRRQINLAEHTWDGRSLFDFVVKNVDNLFDSRPVERHLICDDRSGEIADFIYVEPTRRRLFLLHAKAAGSATARGIAPAKYEVVTSQATKNLRFLDTGHLLERLRADNGIPIERSTWWGRENEEMARVENRTLAIAAIEHLGAFPEKWVVLLQPHTTRKVWEDAERQLREGELSGDDRIQHLRLKTLLADLEVVCKKVGASLMVWGDSDGSTEGALFHAGVLR
ncbi:MAG: hypothetical protein ABUT39_04995 [Acidobacteriota bacterium]